MTTIQSGSFSTLNASVPPDPFKHVKYTLGMVLGADDFNQEFAYQDEHLHWLTRETLGYGTVCGLQVTYDTGGPGGKRRIVVDSGSAITPRGELVRVPAIQCAVIDNWLEANSADLPSYIHTGSPDSAVSLYVVLGYRACPTDPMPIPGDPCRSEDEAKAESRWEDDFQLQIRFTPPEQRQEDAIRDFVDWLRQVEVDPTIADDAARRETFEAAIRQAIPQLMSPPESPIAGDYILASPPADLRIPAGSECDYWRRAFRIWAVELRRLWLGTGESCAGVPPEEDGVLLAEVVVPLAGDRDDTGSPLDIREDRRPYLLPLRLLQEWLLCGTIESALALIVAGNTVKALTWGNAGDPGSSPAYSREDHVHPLPHPLSGEVTGPLDDTQVTRLLGKELVDTDPTSLTGTKVLTFTDSNDQWSPQDVSALISPGTTVVEEITWGQGSSVGGSMDYSPADHTHGTPANPVDGLALAGDVTGPVTDTTVAAIQGNTVAASTPNNGDVLQYVQSTAATSGKWVPAPIPIVPAPPTTGPRVVAAGGFQPGGAPDWIWPAAGNFRALFLAERTTAAGLPYILYLLQFDDFKPGEVNYVIKGTPLNTTEGPQRTFEVIENTNALKDVATMVSNPDGTPIATVSSDLVLGRKKLMSAPILQSNGIVVRLSGATTKDVGGFMVEISEFPFK